MPRKVKHAPVATAAPYTLQTLPVKKILALDDIQPRVRLDTEALEEYATLYSEAEGEEPLEPIDVFKVGGKHYVSDGFHRLEAATNAGRTELACHVYTGSQQEALRHGIFKNLKRGVKYSQRDMQRILELLLQDPVVSQRADRELGRDLGLSHVTVGRARRRLAHVAVLTPTLTTQRQVVALLALPPTDTEVLVKHNKLKPEWVVHDIAQRMADRKESAETATQAVAHELRSSAESWRRAEAWDKPTPRPRESAEERAERRAENLRWERFRILATLLYPFQDYVPQVPSAEEAELGVKPTTPEITAPMLVAAVNESDRTAILERLADAYTFLDAMKAACQEQWGQWETRMQETAASV